MTTYFEELYNMGKWIFVLSMYLAIITAPIFGILYAASTGEPIALVSLFSILLIPAATRVMEKILD